MQRSFLPMRRYQHLALLETALAVTLWAVSFIYIKIALREVSAFTLVSLRLTIGWTMLAGFAAWRGDIKQVKRGDLPGLALLGAVGITLQQILQVSGQVTADAGVAAFLAATAPAFLIILAAIFLREAVRGWQVAGALLATGGAVLISTGGDLTSMVFQRADTLGNFLVLLSAIVWAVFTLLNRSIVQGRPPALVASGMMFFGWLFTLPLFLAQRGWDELGSMSPTAWGSILYIGVFSSAVAHLLYSHALKYAPASRLAAIQNIEPLIAMLAAVLILSESATVALLFGGGMILIGVAVAERYAPAAKPCSQEATTAET